MTNDICGVDMDANEKPEVIEYVQMFRSPALLDSAKSAGVVASGSGINRSDQLASL